MTGILLNSFKVYKDNFKKILILGISIILPIQLLFTFATNLVALPFAIFGFSLWETMVQVFFTVITFFLIQLPFTNLFELDFKDEEYKLKDIYIKTLQRGYMVYILSLLSAVLIIAGLLFFILPGVLLMILLIAIPQAIVLENKLWWNSVKRSMKFAKQNFWKLLGVILLFTVMDLVVSFIAYFLTALTSNLFIVLNSFIIVGNAIILPYFIFMLSTLYKNWISEYSNAEDMEYKKIGDFSRKPIY
ncbi:hypothetical protein [Fictibacillus phosphorivorans]|uniref:hypothetical protein n=1 Tax=Fictibacillus phosphorivorans TaxID=1221500 RepID=UPI00203F4BD2|nr:hypothetical protein [Fictibacillus phosphorivorans]MCM3719801.1 hypothetical protein [Fictibacillus phosphorivorans]MCM3777528.1 hypothetical protein [Fictibacillus phosphorivorans]